MQALFFVLLHLLDATPKSRVDSGSIGFIVEVAHDGVIAFLVRVYGGDSTMVVAQRNGA